LFRRKIMTLRIGIHRIGVRGKLSYFQLPVLLL
jgi:hypothetical protein